MYRRKHRIDRVQYYLRFQASPGDLAGIPKEEGGLLCLLQTVGSMHSPGLVCSLCHSSVSNCSSLQCSYSSPSNYCAPPTSV